MIQVGPWSLGRTDSAWPQAWPKLWRDRLRWVVRRWVFAVAGFTAGMATVGGMHMDTLSEWWDAEAQVAQLRHEMQALQVANNRGSDVLKGLVTPLGPPEALAFWPKQGTQLLVWPQLQILLSRHGVQLMSLRPAPISHVGSWTSQAVTLHMWARFDDWVAAWATMNARGPVWSIDRLRMTPVDSGVAIEAVLRVWLAESTKASNLASESLPVHNMPGVLGSGEGMSTRATPETLDMFADGLPRRGDGGLAGSSRATSAGGPGAPVFVQPSLVKQTDPAGGSKQGDVRPISGGVASVTGAVASRAAPVGPARDASLASAWGFSSEPATWPLDQVRMVGIWQHARDQQVILVAGPHWVRAHVGQRIGPQGHVVVGVQAQEVRLRAAQGQEHVIRLEKAAP